MLNAEMEQSMEASRDWKKLNENEKRKQTKEQVM
jgi:hypothetical protein